MESPFRFYNANIATLLFSLDKGGHGFSGISANFYPWIHSWLCKNFDKKPEDARKVQHFLTVAEGIVATKYPQCAKLYLNQYESFSISSKCRVMEATFNEEELLRLEHLKAHMLGVCKEVGIEAVAPSNVA